MILTICPDASAGICCAKAAARIEGARTCRSKCNAQVAALKLRAESCWKTDALLTSRSSGPSASDAFATNAPVSPISVRSACKAAARYPFRRNSATSSSASPMEPFAWIATEKPFAARSSAIARPILLADPVIRAVRSLSSFKILLSDPASLPADYIGAGGDYINRPLRLRPRARYSMYYLRMRFTKISISSLTLR